MSSIGQEYLDCNDGVHKYEGRWWFWNDSRELRIGPYDGYIEACNALEIYIEKNL